MVKMGAKLMMAIMTSQIILWILDDIQRQGIVLIALILVTVNVISNDLHPHIPEVIVERLRPRGIVYYLVIYDY